MLLVLAGAFLCLVGGVIGFAVAGLRFTHEMQCLLKRQDRHEAEMWAHVASWSAEASGMDRAEWEGVLHELQQRTREMARKG